MTDYSQSTLSDGTVILYNNRKADLLKYDDLYFPSKPESGKVVPTVDSLVIKNDSTLWRVSAVDSVTYEPTLVPINHIVGEEDEEVSVINYNNSKFRVYVDKRTEPYKVVVDSKLLFCGTNLSEYVLYRVASDGVEESISAYYGATGQYVSDRVPLTTVSSEHPAYKYPTNCHTLTELEEDQPLILRVYNNLGVISAEVTVYVRYASWFNDLQSHTNPIVEFGVNCLQEQGEDFYIYPKQNRDDLNLLPYLVYADGSRVDVPIDSMKCFVYGFEDFVPDYPGRVQTLVFKYFLNRKERTTQGIDTNFLTCTKNLRVISNYINYEVRVSPIPQFDGNDNMWKLRFFAYTTKRDTCYDITELVHYSEGKDFVGGPDKWGREQEVEIEFNLQSIFDTDEVLPGIQTFHITVRDPKVYERYVLRSDITSDHYYGSDGLTRRPVIYKDVSQNVYFIPTSIFKTKEGVIESFYTLADPLYNTCAETMPPTPTHFTFRDATSGMMLTGGVIPIENYFKAISLIGEHSLSDKQTVVVEFVQEIGDGEFLILYGVPVDVMEGYTYQG